MAIQPTPLYQSKGQVPYVPTGYETIRSDIAQKRKIADALNAAGLAGPGPNSRSWVQLLGSLAQSFAGTMMDRKANRQETEMNNNISINQGVSDANFSSAQAMNTPNEELARRFGSDPNLQDNPMLKIILEQVAKSHVAKGDPTRMRDKDGNLGTYQTFEDGSVRALQNGLQALPKMTDVHGVAVDMDGQASGKVLPQDQENHVILDPTTGKPVVNTARVVSALADQGIIRNIPGVSWSGQGGGPTSAPTSSSAPPAAPADPLAALPTTQVTNALARTHGYTPSQANGGDNPQNVVTNKIASLARTVGIDPSQPMTPQQFTAFVQALPGTENANPTWHNPGGIKDGSYAKRQPGYAGADGQYARFSTPEAGSAAYTNLLQKNYYNKGQQSITDIIEGRPVGGQQSASGTSQGLPPQGAGNNPFSISGIIPGSPADIRAKTSAREDAMLTIAQAREAREQANVTGAVPGSDGVMGDTKLRGPAYLASLPADHQGLVQSMVEGKFPMSSKMFSKAFLPYFKEASLVAGQPIDATTYARRQQTQKDFAPSGFGGKQIISLSTNINHLYDLAKAAQGLHQGNSVPANAISNWFGSNVQTDPSLKDYNAALTPLSSELPRFYSNGKGATIPEEAQVRSDFSANSGEIGIRHMVGKTLDKLHGRYAPLINQYATGMSSQADITQLLEQLGGAGMGKKLQDLQTYSKTGKFPEDGNGGTGASAPITIKVISRKKVQ